MQEKKRPPNPKSAFGFEAAEDSPGFMLWQTTVLWQRLIKKTLETYEVSHAQFVIMAVLLWFEEHNKTLTQVDIAHGSKLDKMTVSKSLKKLSSLGYITRIESQKDTRAKWVHLTHKGKEIVSRLIPLVEGIDEKFFKPLNGNERETLLKVFRKLIEGGITRHMSSSSRRRSSARGKVSVMFTLFCHSCVSGNLVIT